MMLFAGVTILVILFNCDDTQAIVYGKIAEPGEFKYQVLLKLTKGNRNGICGGGIIDETHVVTAWHCVDSLGPDNIEVVVGGVKYRNDPNAKSYRISNIRLHESRSCKPGEKRCYDIAILTMQEPITYSAYIDEIALPTSDIVPDTECVFAGWGVTDEKPGQFSDELRYGYGKILDRFSCFGLIGFIKNYEFCFRSVENSKATINDGDSGTPFVCNGVLTGIAIRGSGLYTDAVLVINVYKVLDFIRGSSESDICNIP